ncbi:hypothetical protein LG331_07600 [Vreelandella aquamarina]|uniref:hypothetical protein n=2 Tax=Pseudomonadota TaxID=1224 RepID=UPI00384E0321
MHHQRPVRYPRLKVALLFAIFAAPIVTAWGMVTWDVGIPRDHTAHGNITLEVPPLQDWPLMASIDASEQWTLVFECHVRCEEQQDELWRLHRALGREATRLQRLRIGGGDATLPGETKTVWQSTPAWRNTNDVWLFDPMGRPALAFSADVSAADILDDIRHLFKVNPI